MTSSLSRNRKSQFAAPQPEYFRRSIRSLRRCHLSRGKGRSRLRSHIGSRRSQLRCSLSWIHMSTGEWNSSGSLPLHPVNRRSMRRNAKEEHGRNDRRARRRSYGITKPSNREGLRYLLFMRQTSSVLHNYSALWIILLYQRWSLSFYIL